jgi:hypothetical protein
MERRNGGKAAKLGFAMRGLLLEALQLLVPNAHTMAYHNWRLYPGLLFFWRMDSSSQKEAHQ